MAIQMYTAVFLVHTELLRSNEIDLEKHKLRVFLDHRNFGQYNAFSGVIYVQFPSFLQPDFEYLNIFKFQIEHAS